MATFAHPSNPLALAVSALLFERPMHLSTAAENRATCRRQSGAVQRGVF
jgi:hypothetical protein